MLNLKTSDNQNLTFKSGYDLWIWAMLNRPKWFLSEKMTDNREVSDMVKNAKVHK